MIIYEYSRLHAYSTGATREISSDGAIPVGWTTEAVPQLSIGMHARWNSNGWVVTDLPPPVLPDEDQVEQKPPAII